jgi:hypothetical protein
MMFARRRSVLAGGGAGVGISEGRNDKQVFSLGTKIVTLCSGPHAHSSHGNHAIHYTSRDNSHDLSGFGQNS